MEAQRERARASSAFGMDYNSLVKVDGETRFLGYQGVSGAGQIVAPVQGRPGRRAPGGGEEGVVVLDQTPFYAESGGQVGDSGYLEAAGVRFDVRDTTKAGGAHLHHGVVARGNLSVGGAVRAEVDASVRQATALNHSATHLLHAALRQVLGDHVQQKGSLVDSQRLRFDFSHFEAIKAEQLKALEDIVNAEIRRNTEVETEETDIDTAKAKGAMALFGEVRRPGARTEHGRRFLRRAVRWHPRIPHRRHRPVQDPLARVAWLPAYAVSRRSPARRRWPT